MLCAVATPGLVGKLPDTVILTLLYILGEMESETFRVSARRPIYFSGEQFRTDAKCTDEHVVLGGWELQTRRWFSLKLDRTQVPYLFKAEGGALSGHPLLLNCFLLCAHCRHLDGLRRARLGRLLPLR